MKSLLLLLIGLCSSCALSAAEGEELLKQFGREDLAPAAQRATGARVKVENDSSGQPSLVIDNPERLGVTVEILEINAPPITSPLYAVTGEVRYENASESYLETWNHFPAGAYFTRTLGIEGPLARIRGSSGWRAFSLPFNASGTSDVFSQPNSQHPASAVPHKLILNLVMGGSGHVEVRNIHLVQSAVPAVPPRTIRDRNEPWWSDRTAGLFGGIAGASIGILAAAAEWFAARGKARRWIIAGTWVVIVAGIVSFGFGLVALGARQPYAVVYPLLLLGVLCVAILSSRLRRFRRQYDDSELRRMSSLDAAA